VSGILGIPVEEMRHRGRERQRTTARSHAIYWADRELNMPGVHLAKRYGLTQSAVVHASRRGEEIAEKKKLPADAMN
jgi:chromosomal replication initiation ATPase DnaA